jgi:hypothetical protein
MGGRRCNPEPRVRLAAAILAVAMVTVTVPTTIASPTAPIHPEAESPSRDEVRELIEPLPDDVLDEATVVEPGERSLGYPAGIEPEIHPGRQLILDVPGKESEAGGDGPFRCTMNFVYEVQDTTGYERTNGQPKLEVGDKLIGTAGHCVLPGDFDNSTQEGYEQPDVTVCVALCNEATSVGVMWSLGNVLYARQAADGQQLGEDYAFIDVPDAFEDELDAEVPVWSGPTAVRDRAMIGEQVATFGQGTGFGEAALDPRIGVSQGDNAYRGSGGAFHQALASTPGDSGGPIVALHDPFAPGEIDSQALGDLTHIIPEGSIVGTYSHYAVDFTEEETGVQLEMVTVDETNLGANTPVASS